MTAQISGDIVDQDESCDIVGTLYDTANPNISINKGAIISLTCTLLDVTHGGETGPVINSRDGQDIFDTNDGTVDADGTVTLRLQPADNPNVNSTRVGKMESHQLTLTWTWNDGVSVRTGKESRIISVRSVVTAT